MLESALNNVVSHFNRGQVRALGEYAIVGAIGIGVYEIVKEGVKEGVKEYKRRVELTHQHSIHAYQDKQTGQITVNTSGNGHKIAEIHKGDNGKYYKFFAGSWHVWDGSSNWKKLAAA